MFSVHVLLSGSHSDAIDLKFCGQHRHVVSYHVQNQVLHKIQQILSVSNQSQSQSRPETKDLTANLRQGNQSIIVRPRAGTKKIYLVGEPNVKPMRLKQNPSIWITQTIVQ
jgi:hypothetical protein